MGGRHALMWSGGKDSALALNRATAAGIDVARLVNFYDADTGRVRFHATRVAMLEAQAAQLGVELRAIPTSWSDMGDRLSRELDGLRSEGFEGVVLGDIHLADVRAWYEERVTGAGLKHVEPIWGEPPAELLSEFVETGGRAVVTCVDLTRLQPGWLGRIIDERFVDEIRVTAIDPCGENGEYHSFAFQGPHFRRPVEWQRGEVRSEPRFSQLDVLPGRPE
jgi:uncharacterized protein (TIGR00290 family)